MTQLWLPAQVIGFLDTSTGACGSTPHLPRASGLGDLAKGLLGVGAQAGRRSCDPPYTGLVAEGEESQTFRCTGRPREFVPAECC